MVFERTTEDEDDFITFYLQKYCNLKLRPFHCASCGAIQLSEIQPSVHKGYCGGTEDN